MFNHDTIFYIKNNMYKVKRFTKLDPAIKSISNKVRKDENGNYHNDVTYHFHSGKTVTETEPVSEYTAKTIEWIKGGRKGPRPETKRYSLARRFHDAKKAYKNALDHSEENAKGYDKNADRAMELKMNGYNNLLVHKSNPNYINKMKAEGTYESTEKKWRNAVDKVIKNDRKMAENLRKRPKIEAFKQAVNAFKSKGFSKSGSNEKAGFISKLKSGLLKSATNLGNSELQSQSYRRNPRGHMRSLALSQHTQMMNDHMAAHNQMANTAIMHHQMHTGMGMFSDRSFSLKSRFDSAKRSYKNTLKNNDEVLSSLREGMEYSKNWIESGEAKKSFDEMMEDPYYKDDKFRDERERNYMKSEEKNLKNIQKDIKVRENHPKTLALKNAISSFLKNN